jgi:hypothetical protein
MSSSEDRISSFKRLSPEEWRARRATHRAKVLPWVEDRKTRASAADWHPVFDFLFEYYPFRAAYLLRWSPGAGVLLMGAHPSDVDWSKEFLFCDEGAFIPPWQFPRHRLNFIGWAIKYFERIADRPPYFGCFGLHEWAMLYKAPKARHQQVPLRLSGDEISQVVEAGDVRCSHFDAFRFFTPEAAPLNKHLLSRDSTADFDQRGCIHVNMDLYKFANKIAPWCSAELLADTFLQAVRAREVDMRASPYDLSSFGFSAIRIEDKAGREEYVALQRELSERAVPLRARLLDEYRYLNSWLGEQDTSIS